MSFYSQRALLFPRVNQMRLNEQRLKKTIEIEKIIMDQLKQNKTTSLYNIQEDRKPEHSFVLKRKHLTDVEKSSKKLSPHKKVVKTQNSMRSEQKNKVKAITFDNQCYSNQKIKNIKQLQNNKKLLWMNQSFEKIDGKKQLKIKAQANVQEVHSLAKINTKRFKNVINIRRILNSMHQSIPKQCTKPQKPQKVKNFFKKAYQKKNQKETTCLKQKQLKLTSLGGWKTDQQRMD